MSYTSFIDVGTFTHVPWVWLPSSISFAQFDADLLAMHLKQNIASIVDCKGNRYNLSPEEVVPHMIDFKGEFVSNQAWAPT